MSSLRRTLASRANGRLSRGPVTTAGKLRSSLNATRHGLLAHRLVLDDESAAAFQSTINDYCSRIRPVDGMELDMVEDMVADLWRLQRTRAVETRMLNNAAADPAAGPDPLDRITAAFTTLNASGALPLIHRYESRLHTMIQRSLQNLALLRTLMPIESPVSGLVLEEAGQNPVTETVSPEKEPACEFDSSCPRQPAVIDQN